MTNEREYLISDLAPGVRFLLVDANDDWVMRGWVVCSDEPIGNTDPVALITDICPTPATIVDPQVCGLKKPLDWLAGFMAGLRLKLILEN